MVSESKDQNNKKVLHSFDDVREKFYVYITDPISRKNIEDAYAFAEEAHKDQKRKSGEPYIHHLIEVCYILAELQCGPATLCTGLLHDVVEDTNVSLDEIEKRFGSDVRYLVDSLTKIQRMKLSHKQEEEFVAEDHRKIFLGMAKDVRVIVVKLADRLHNMRTLDSLAPHRKIALARETNEVFVPIAHRLGINTIKSELEDLSLKYLEPEKYSALVDQVNSKIKNGMKSLESFSKRVADMLFEHNIPFTMSSRVKSLSSIYKKIYEKNHKFEEIFDILAIRIIVQSELQCYEVLGIIHAAFTPIPGRFKDYIAMPKPNMYQSLHTCILFGDGNTFEVQIRTKEMDETAESGIAAHWRYKEGTNYNPKKEQQEIEERLHWLKDLVQVSSDEESSDAKEYLSTLSHDIFEANIYVFTPKGNVISLPSGSTPLDFAYKIHTGVAEQAVGAIVNKTMVPLNTVLKTGDIVEIKTSKTSAGPNEGWLKIVSTNFAKNHIRKFLQKKNANFVREEKIQKGKAAAYEAFKVYDISEEEMLKLLGSDNVLNEFDVDNVEELLVRITNKNPTPGAIISFLNLRKKQEEIKLEKAERYANDDCPVYVPGAGKIAINLGSCCTPIPGDEIIGYITKGKGITVHRKNCPNIVNETKRLIEVKWKDNHSDVTSPVDLKIECQDRPNLVVDLMSNFSSKKVPVTSLNAVYHKQTNQTTIMVTIYVKDSDDLQEIINNLLNVKSVYEITRVIH